MAATAPAATARRAGLRRAVCCALAIALLAGCGKSTGQRKICPKVDILEYADQLVRFLPGPGRDVTDVVFRGQLRNYQGECAVDSDSVEIEMVLEFALERGPADRARKAAFEYFVAIPQFHPDPTGKRRFAVEVSFASGQNRALYRDEIKVAIPLKRGQSSADFSVFVGFQLSAAELDYNQRAVRP